MILLVAGLAVFLGTHSVSMIAPQWRAAAVDRFGEAAWKGVYSLLSAAGLVLIVYGYGAARMQPVLLYVPPDWLRLVAVVLLAGVFPLLFAAYLPGALSRRAAHPMLAAVKLWAVAHLLANGTLADVVLFGALLAWAVADRISMKHRVQRPLPSTLRSRFNDLLAIGLGLLAYGALLGGVHSWLFGVSPLP